MHAKDTSEGWNSYVAAENRRTADNDLLRIPRVLQPSGCGVRVRFCPMPPSPSICASVSEWTPLNSSDLQVTVSQNKARPQSITLFSTNDYLGLSSHPQVQCAIAAAAASFGMGPRSAAIVAGHTSLHERLECRLASLKKTEACLLFPTGFAANVATISALATDSTVAIFSDELNHASLIDGCRLARLRGVQTHVFRHKDYGHLRDLLQEHHGRPRKLVVTDGVFSMDGDIADLQVLCLGGRACL